ncbi:hypothetical protein [Streptomyces sp. SID3343]|uniref:hypothetical protein n=1 Tax=Streptomyces sp. SID3343 TaxID=2690260 RepID=UPI00136E0343|nr:hypothetical protein [Streptomyces sp. SID3343]MYW03834.1 hypothetical protein [Streptomyces sp. SID3343]
MIDVIDVISASSAPDAIDPAGRLPSGDGFKESAYERRGSNNRPSIPTTFGCRLW